MIKIENLSKSYNQGAVKAVDNLSLQVRAGEIFGFLGPNGAGKTTTIKMMVGLLKPDSGSITINGYNILDDPLAVKKSISYVPDTPEIYEKLTGIEYLNFLGDVYGVPAAVRKEKIIALLDMSPSAARWATWFNPIPTACARSWCWWARSCTIRKR